MKFKNLHTLAVALGGLVGVVILILTFRPRRRHQVRTLWTGGDGDDPFADMIEEGAGLLAQWEHELAEMRNRRS